jgi:very-short-patch-repair endonuclease
MITANHKNYSHDYDRARELRHQSSPMEQWLWKKLRNAQKISGLKFRRQHPLSPYIADFVCLQAKLVIELDGHSHDSTQGYDHRRDAYLRQLGFTVIRLSNHDMAINPDGVVLSILQEAKSLINKALKNDPSSAKTKELAEANSKFSLPPPQGGRSLQLYKEIP